MIATVTVLAVLIHHETVAAITHVPPTGTAGGSGSRGVHHPPPPSTPPHPHGHTAPTDAAAETAADDDGACSGTAMQHCTAADIDIEKPAPAHQPSTGRPRAVHHGAAGGRDVPGTTGRAPPDLSALSRLLL
ncbi:hypothetical protein ACIQU3_04140 [Streptomyces sp. NPDC101110]|uniref:hypothetical protein n=1 Tax=Streptomyces sp. NPDC101110 TaxID=3366104 RepID=UPI0037FE1A0B